MKKITIGILAHVDAGKTTLSEALLFLSGKLRSLGRVDHKSSFLDHHAIERERGITVFSKHARFSYGDCEYILLDTPGHADLSAEAERTLSLLDYAILVVSAPDGIQSHMETIWQLLEHYKIPTILFVNKCDISIRLKEDIVKELATSLSPLCIPFYEEDTQQQRNERLALLHESFLELALNGDNIPNEDISSLIAERKLFPCLFGSALRLQGIEHLLEVLAQYTCQTDYEKSGFGANVFKILHTGTLRLTFLKITQGMLKVRDEVSYINSEGQEIREKISQIRLYSGDKYEQVDTVFAGDLCAVIGLSATAVGQGIGQAREAEKPIIEPVIAYRLCLPDNFDPKLYFPKLKELEEEEPTLHLRWCEDNTDIEVRLMGEIQTELFQRMVQEHLGIPCTLCEGKILYKERVSTTAIGIGHFEPLRHYAEVLLRVEPLPLGTGLIIDCRVAPNTLETNWQRLILSHLYEKRHIGCAIGAELTDTKITLIAGKAHQKHTEGGDFREATLRAVRHGLIRGGCDVLEPYYRFRIDVPTESVGKVMHDLQLRYAAFEITHRTEERCVLSGRAPASEMFGYPSELLASTHGLGKITCNLDGYDLCHNAEALIKATCYDAAADLDNPPHSVFCANGAGFVVPYDQVEQYMHLEIPSEDNNPSPLPNVKVIAKRYEMSYDELEALMLREFGPIRRRSYREPKINAADSKSKRQHKVAVQPPKNLTIIDGYNFIYAFEPCRRVADSSLEKAREVLMDLLSSYVAFTKKDVILVFDAYLVKDGMGSDFIHDGYRIVYTKENQTADAYIEKLMFELGPDYSIRVITADRLVQFSALHSGILRVTPAEFESELTAVSRDISDFIRRLDRELQN